MPELPEVETMVRGLRPALAGRTIRAAKVRDPFLLEGCTPRQFEKQARGSEVASVGRRGKWVVMALEASRGVIVIQPRMTGGFWLVPPAREDHVRLTFEIDGTGQLIWFCDTRRLGRIAWYANLEEAGRAFARSQGPDALEIQREELAAGLAKTRRSIKPTLMDQKVLAGVGNIYADEILFRARVHPLRTAADLSSAEVGRIHEAIGMVLAEAIAAEGSSFDAGYRTVLGLEGGFLAGNAMYGRGGLPCPDCGGPITKAYLAGLLNRPSHFCPNCQPETGKRHSRRPATGGRGPTGRDGKDRVE